MKRLMIFLLSTVLAAPMATHARHERSLAVGLEAGSITGANVKLWTNEVNALEVTVGSAWPGTVEFKGSYLWHQFGVFHSEKEDLDHRLPLYFGAGGVLVGSGTPYLGGVPLAGVYGVAGISYLFRDQPFDLFLELRPTLYLTPSALHLFQAGVGSRYYF